eukprot:7380581-Prymnesium_polylepis.4
MPAYRSPPCHNDETLFNQEELADVPTWARFQSRVRGVLHCWDARELAQHFYHRKTNGLAPTALNPITNLPFHPRTLSRLTAKLDALVSAGRLPVHLTTGWQ